MSESDNCKAGEERPREELTTKRIVSVLLADIVGLDDQEVPDWTNRIMTSMRSLYSGPLRSSTTWTKPWTDAIPSAET